jgi:hypothetical protein
MEILARGVGRRKEAVAQVQIVKGTGQFLINSIPAQQYLHNNICSILSVKAPLNVLNPSNMEASTNVALIEIEIEKEKTENLANVDSQTNNQPMSGWVGGLGGGGRPPFGGLDRRPRRSRGCPYESPRKGG